MPTTSAACTTTTPYSERCSEAGAASKLMTVCMDWGRLPLPARIYRASVSVRAPFVAAGSKRLLRAGR